ncbi:MAG: DUF4251 domain-containing protein [Bacteroidia bacterium]|nr:DUF4251 domain-containing protein [Bacteroidia bacterium]
MKQLKLIAIIVSAVLLSGCSALAALTAEDEAESAGYVAEALASGNIKFEVNQIMPSQGRTMYSQDGYYLKIVDGKADSHLPFFGVSRNASAYGTEPSGIRFESCPIQIDDSRSRADKGHYVWRFIAITGREKVDVIFDFYENGTAHLQCKPANRSIMNYSGKIVWLEEEKK